MNIRTVATASVADKMESSPEFHDFVLSSIQRLLAGDWGEVSEDDAATNTDAPLYALGTYWAPDGPKIWVRRDYNVITVLFPSEY